MKKYKASEKEISQFCRNLAHSLKEVRDFSAFIDTEEKALAFFQRTVNDGKCPVCRGRCRREMRELICRRCPRRSIVLHTPMHGTSTSILHLLAAVWHTNVDTRSIAARHFSRQYGMKRMSAWRLLHKTRLGVRNIVPNTSTTRMQILGRTHPKNAAYANVASRGLMTAVRDGQGLPDMKPWDKPKPVDALWLGHLRAWIVNTFHGVTAKHFPLYMAEFSRRHGRLSDMAIEVVLVAPMDEKEFPR